MTDHALALQTIEVNLSSPAVTQTQPFVAVPTEPGETTRWHAVAVELGIGDPIQFVPIVGNPRMEWQLDLPLRATFRVSFDVDVSALPLPNADTAPTHEVQLYRNGQLMLFGPVTARRGNTRDRVWEYTAYDPLWYFTKRYFGEGSRRNWVANGSFDTNLTGWTATAGLTASSSSEQHILGTKSLKLVNTNPAGHNYEYTRFPMSAGPLGLALFLTAWVYVDEFTTEPFGGRGAYIERVGASSGLFWSMADLNENDTPIRKWSRLSCYVAMPPNTTETIEVRLYAPEGTIFWDAVSVTIAESVSLVNGNSPGGDGWDQTYIAQFIARYLSGGLPVGTTYTKSNLRISAAGDPSGITKERTYQFFDHQNGLDALSEFTESSDGFDYRIECTPTTRVFTTYFPSIGQLWDCVFRWENYPEEPALSSAWGITYVDNGETIEGSASDITEQGGWGTGSGREEAAFTDVNAFGGLTLELVEQAPDAAPIDLLQAIADSRGEQLAKPIATPVLTIIEPRDPETAEVILPLIGELLPGDIIPVVVIDGSLQIGAAQDPLLVRVASVTLQEDETLLVAISP